MPQGRVPTRGDRNVEVITYILMASKKGSAGEALPSELDGVAKQLKSVFGYTDFRLLDASVVRAREGISVDTTGNATTGGLESNSPPANYQFAIQERADDSGRQGFHDSD